MDMRDEWLAALRQWAANNEAVKELWVFGSRAKGNARPDSDIDVAVLLMPPIEGTDWAMFAYFDNFYCWKGQLRFAVDWNVDLVAIGPKFEMEEEVKATGVRVWARE